MITVTFKQSNSASFFRALELCAGLKNFEEYVIEKNRHFILHLNKQSLRHALPALKHIGKLKSKRVLINGSEVDWDNVFRFIPCFKQSLKAKKGRKYCYGLNADDANLWGCHKTLDVEYSTHGTLDLRTHHWTWDKPGLKTALSQASCAQCPAHRPDHKRIVDALPDRVHPETEEGYSFDILTLPSQIRKTYTISTGYWDEAHVIGVRITGENVVSQLRRKTKCPLSNNALKNHVIFGHLGEF